LQYLDSGKHRVRQVGADGRLYAQIEIKTRAVCERCGLAAAALVVNDAHGVSRHGTQSLDALADDKFVLALGGALADYPDAFMDRLKHLADVA
jgi:hypothetical protein